MTASEIHRALGLPKQTVHRLCNTLVAAGILAREEGSRRLRPGRRARLLANGVLAKGHAPIIRRQILAEIAQETGETVNLVIARQDGMFYLDRVETNWAFRVQLPIGTHVPFHCTASGKVFLSTLEDEVRQRMVRSLALPQLTPGTITQSSALLDELDTVRSKGFAVDDQEFVDGMAAVAVPVRDGHKRFFAALAVHGPTQRFPATVAKTKVTFLHEAAARLGQALF